VRLTKLLGLVLTLLLAACGGGGGSSSLSARDAGAEGFWVGTANTGVTVFAAILENGESWGVYTSGRQIVGTLYGNTSTANSSITISGTDLNLVSNVATAGTLTGTFAPRATINATSTQGASVSLSYDAIYDIPASSANAVGTWDYVGRSLLNVLTPAAVTIDGSGAFSLTQTNCNSSGSITPRPNGKNVFNVSITSVGSGCATGFSTLTGVAFLDVDEGFVLILALTANKSDGLIILADKR
jgi:hypothetical protein